MKITIEKAENGYVVKIISEMYVYETYVYETLEDTIAAVDKCIRDHDENGQWD